MNKQKGKLPMKIFIALLLIVHGFIAACQSPVSFNPAAGIKNPTWLAWWPANLGQSWPLNALELEHSLAVRMVGIFWLIAGAALIGAGLGVLGFLVPTAWWRSLALTGAIILIAMLAVYYHPFYSVGLGASVVLLVSLVGEGWPLFSKLGL